MAFMMLSNRIKEIRASTGLNKVQFGKLFGVTHSAVGQWENGDTKALKSDVLIDMERKTGYRSQWISKGTLPKKRSEELAHSEIHNKISRLNGEQKDVIEGMLDQMLSPTSGQS